MENSPLQRAVLQKIQISFPVENKLSPQVVVPAVRSFVMVEFNKSVTRELRIIPSLAMEERRSFSEVVLKRC